MYLPAVIVRQYIEDGCDVFVVDQGTVRAQEDYRALLGSGVVSIESAQVRSTCCPSPYTTVIHSYSTIVELDTRLSTVDRLRQGVCPAYIDRPPRYGLHLEYSTCGGTIHDETMPQEPIGELDLGIGGSMDLVSSNPSGSKPSAILGLRNRKPNQVIPSCSSFGVKCS